MSNESVSAIKKINKAERKGKLFLYLCILVLALTFGGALVYAHHMTERLQDITERLEDTQKGNVCIFLIKPENRTEANVKDCIDKNKTTPTKESFNFKKSDSPAPAPIQYQPVSPLPEIPKVELIAVTPKKTPVAEPEPEPEEPPEEKPHPIIRINELTKLLECQFPGDTVWRKGDRC